MRRLLALLVLAGGCSNAPPPMEPADGLQARGFPASTPARFRARFETTKGAFTVEVIREWAPRGADRLLELLRAGAFERAAFFRVVPGFVVQFGIPADPQVTAAWKDARIPDDPVRTSNTAGTLTFATSGPNTRTSQLFINFKDNPRLDGMGFAPLGKVVEGMEVVDSLNAEYREQPLQDRIQREGEAYLLREFPRLDVIRSIRYVRN